MVLSNKKLKQKLRAELAQSLSSSLSNSDPKNDGHETKPPTKALKVLLDSATQRPRLSKREKNRQKNQSEDSKNDKEEADEADKKKEGNGSVGKKRKRDEKDGVLGSNVNSDNTKKKKKKKKKKKNQMKKNKIKKGKNEEVEKETLEIRNEAKMGAETNENIVDNSEVIGIESTKVYVGGIPFYSTEDDIRSYFEGCGTVTEVDCMTFPESGNFRGIAIINFKTEAAAKRALALDGSDMGGLFLTIQPYKSNRSTTNIKSSNFSPKALDGYNRIYVGNLSWDITEDDLRNFLSGCKISYIKFGKDKDSGEFRGYAHVDFSDNLSFTMALKLDQKIVCGRPAKISCAVPLKKGVTDGERTDRSDQRSQPKTTTNTELKAMTLEKGPAKVTMAEVIEPISVSITTETNSNANISTSGAVKSGKMRRRSCYECGEKGHISSDCPKRIVSRSEPKTTTNTEVKEMTQEKVPAKVTMAEVIEPISVSITTETNSNANISTSAAVKSGKMRRRNCYECGEKGHISSDCPKRIVDSTNVTVG